MPTIAGFSIEDAERIKATVLWREQHYQNPTPAPRSRYPLPLGGNIFPAKFTTSISGGSDTSPSTFTFTLLQPGGSTAALATGTAGLTGNNIAANLTLTLTGGATRNGFVVQYGGFYYLVSVDKC